MTIAATPLANATTTLGVTMKLEEIFDSLDIFAGENVLGKIMRHLDENGSITKDQALELVAKATNRNYE